MNDAIKLLCVTLVSLVCCTARADEIVDSSIGNFDTTIAPLLAQNCLECHRREGAIEPSGGLDLSSRASVLAGGESGPGIAEGDFAKGLIWKKISAGEMPPETSLSESDKTVLLKWISEGATWGDDSLDLFRFTTAKRAGYDWWALQRITDPPIPSVDVSVSNPIDAFVVDRLSKAGLAMSQRAAPGTLVRRLATKLNGMHADVDVVQQFEGNPSDVAFSALVDRFLDSEHYGERWARHWLDVARFGESQGFERDKFREHAWRYRDWVIRAVNADMPYDQFARMQIAGDVFPEHGNDGVIATGFLVGGAYDEVGQSQQSAAMRAVVRQDELEDYVGTLCQTFLGLTANCARCHDHKFDPIRQSEYYALCSSLDGVRPGNRDITPPEVIQAAKQESVRVAEKLRSLQMRIDDTDRQVLEQLNARRRSQGTAPLLLPPLAHWTFDDDLDDQFGTLHAKAHGGAFLEDGGLVVDGKQAHALTGPLPRNVTAKTLAARVILSDLDQRGGGVLSLMSQKSGLFDAIVYGERQPQRWMAGSNNFARSKNVGGAEEAEANRAVHLAISYASDGTISLYRDGQAYGTSYQTTSPPQYDTGEAVVAFGMRLLPTGGNRMLAGRIEEASLFDRALDPVEIAELAAGAKFLTEGMLADELSAERLAQRAAWKTELDALHQIDTRPQRDYVYAIQPAQPENPTQLLLRGNTATPAGEVSAGGIASVQGIAADFGLAVDALEAERRRALATWITSRDNPLFARVIVNRLWHYHFGTGLVPTPNDFGFTGGAPSHPELLDYLASRLIESDWSLKSIQRLIVTSATWQQASIVSREGQLTTADALGRELDAGNRLVWRGNRGRQDAETIRDSILMVAGQLNAQVGGPPYRDFETFNFNSQFYDVGDPQGAEFNRRTIYRMCVRSGRHRLLDAFDCPDPSATAPDRPATTTPLQSLSLMNHSFVLRMADHFADRVLAEGGADVEAQVRRAVELAWCRQPNRDELEACSGFVQSHGLPALCRVLFNSNEFLYVD